MILSPISFWILALSIVYVTGGPLNTLYEWKYLDFDWASPEIKQQAINSGNYNASANALYDVDVSRDGRIFVTIARTAGVPASLCTVTDRTGDGGPILKPYPDWSWAASNNCSGIINVFRVMITECNRLYVLDNGMMGSTSACPAKLMVFDLTCNRLVRSVIIPNEVAKNARGQGLLVTPVVQERTCDNIQVFIADVVGRGIIVWNGRDAPWRLENEYFNPDPKASTYNIAGQTFTLNDSIIGMTLSPHRYLEGTRMLYFRPLASFGMYSASIVDLQNSNGNPRANIYTNLSSLMPFRVQSAAMAFAAENVLFFTQMNDTSLLCWNREQFQDSRISTVLKDETRLQFASGMKVIPAHTKRRYETLMVLTNRWQIQGAGLSYNPNEVNFRILSGKVIELLRHTPCAPRKG